MTTYEECCDCGSRTGRAGRHDDSLYANDLGPYCEDCWYELPEKLASLNAELLAALKDISANARIVSDPDYGHATDIYVVPLRDVEQAQAAIARAESQQ